MEKISIMYLLLIAHMQFCYPAELCIILDKVSYIFETMSILKYFVINHRITVKFRLLLKSIL